MDGPALHEYVGTCACGRTEVRLTSELAATEFQPRSDRATCQFCSEYDGVWISDPKGTLGLPPTDATTVRRFASEQVQFHFCSECNTLLYASFEDGGRIVAVVRVALFEHIRQAALPTLVTNFETESLADGRQRRLAKWTPVADLV
jgi:hypothetical protein